MAEITFIAPVETIKGKLQNRDKTIFRRKRIFDANGHVIGQLSQEAYIVKNPRDWKKTPPKGAEKQRIDNWTAACQQVQEIKKNPELLAKSQSRRERVSRGCGRPYHEVNNLTRQFEQMKKMMKQMSNGNMKLPPNMKF